MPSLEAKVVLVTGGSAGIGAALAACLGARGAKLVLVARTESRGKDALVLTGDITEPAVRERAIERTLDRFGRLDALINNAGVGAYYRASTTPMETARRVMEVNFFAPLALTQLAVPHLKASGGSLVSVSSIAALVNLPWLPVYSASKAAITAITASLRSELQRDGIHVMDVFPGYVKTDFQENATGPKPPPEVVKGKRFAISPEACAEAIVQGLERRKKRVIAPASGRLLIEIHRLFPGFIEARVGRV